MMKSIILGAAVATGVAKTTWTDLANPAFEYSFATWKAEHGAKNGGKFLGSEEAFNANVAEIRKWNSEAHSYKKGVNQVRPPRRSPQHAFYATTYRPPPPTTALMR
jgi:hypothetical protein